MSEIDNNAQHRRINTNQLNLNILPGPLQYKNEREIAPQSADVSMTCREFTNDTQKQILPIKNPFSYKKPTP